MTREFRINDLESGVDVVHHKDSDYVEFHTVRAEGDVQITLSGTDLMKVVLVAVEAGLIDRREIVIDLQT